MEERKLNFNAPLMSVRRSSARTASSKKIENLQQRSRRLTLSCKADSSLDQVTEPVAVPFHWEQIPGRPKDDSVLDSHHHEEASITPRFPSQMVLDVVKFIEDKKPEDQDEFRPQVEANSFSERLDVNQKAVINSEIVNDDDDDVYSDALDTLSPTDSFSVNCSVSGVSGFDNLVVKPSGTFTLDPQTRDFMMSRFLPAAKAMTLEQPHYASRKQPVSGEQPRQITKVVQRDRTPPITRNESLNIMPYHQDVEDEESEDGGDEYSDSANITTKGCGFLPRLCIKNSLCLLNPVPAMKIRTHNSMSSSRDSHDFKKLNKAAFARSQSPTIKRPAKDAVNKQKLENDVRSPRLAGVENKIACGSNRFNFASDRQMISRTSPFRRSSGLSPYRNEASQSPFRGGGFPGVPKELESFKVSKLNSYKGYSKSQELVPYHAIRRGSQPVSPTVEKTLYVDTVNVAGILSSNSGPSNMKKGSLDSAEKDLKTLLKSREIQEIAAVKCLNVPRGEGRLEHKGLQSSDSDFSQDSMALVCISAAANESANTGGDQVSNEDDDTVNAKTNLVVCPLPPILPKTPSESWLWRTLPSISSRNPSSHLYRGTSFQSKRQDSKISSASSKWENIVKSSYLHHDHVRYSEELFPHASQQTKKLRD